MRNFWRKVQAAGLLLVVATTGAAAQGESVHAEHRGIGVEEQTALEGVAVEPDRSLEILPDRSLFIRHPALLADLSFAAVMEQLAVQAGATGGKALFRQWWSTVVPGPADAVLAGLACPAAGVTARVPTLNSFTMRCDHQFEAIATMYDPLGANSDTPPFRIIGAVNRIDLLEPGTDTPDCGEYRVIAAWNPQWAGWPAFGDKPKVEMFMNFEAIIADPDKDGRLCAAIQEFWARFSNVDETGSMPADAAVAEALRRFYLEGGRLTPDGRLLPQGAPEDGFDLGPALQAGNMGGDPADRRGQIRVNTLTRIGWVLREFEFAPNGDTSRIVAVPVGGAIEPTLFAGDAPGNERLGNQIFAGRDAIMADINTFTFEFDAALQASQMVISTSGPRVPDYAAILREPPNTARQSLMNWAMVMRLEALSCAGCHHNVADSAQAGFVDHMGKPVLWPGSLTFTHIKPELGADGGYVVSDLVRCTALPHREAVMRAVLGALIDPTTAPYPPTNCSAAYPAR